MRHIFVILTFLTSSLCHAGTVTVDFTASQFFKFSFFPSQIPLTNNEVVHGQIKYQSSSLAGPIESIAALDLNIAGNTFALADVGFANNGFFRIIGALPSGVSGIGSGVTDFWFDFYPEYSSAFQFLYALKGDLNLWRAGNVSMSTSFDETTNEAPEPASLSLIALGLLGIAAARPGPKTTVKPVDKREPQLAVDA